MPKVSHSPVLIKLLALPAALRVPAWLKNLPSLRHLDVSCNASINLGNLTMLTQLEVLVLQNLDLSQPMVSSSCCTSVHCRRL